ncbi:MAG: AAA family ATPase [Myxococcales bacterium]|nr:AAA family ATPase [Myxococcales bacterium]
MLRCFSVSNYLCFGSPLTLDLRPSSATEQSGASASVEPPRIVLISGAGASGKSALLRALGLLRNLTLAGPRAPLPCAAHRFLPPGPTRLAIEVQIEAATWEYELSFDPQQILHERLSVRAAPAAGPVETRSLFSRRAGEPGRPPLVEPGELSPAEGSRLRLLAQSTRAEQPLLNEGLRRGLPLFVPLGMWLRDRLQLLLPEAKFVGLAARAARDPALLDFLTEHLSVADLGIVGLALQREPVPSSYFQSPEELDEVTTELTRFPDSFAETPEGELIAQPAARGPFVDIERVRLTQTIAGPQGGRAELAIDELPATARRLLHLAPLFYGAGEHGTPPCAILDDVGGSLHPQILSSLLARFALDADLPGGRQLIGLLQDSPPTDPDGENSLGRRLLSTLRAKAPQVGIQLWALRRTSVGSQLTVVI